jgi:predicted transposase/invertase (TIGR01784 family)
LKSIIDTAYDEGKLEGGLEGIFECKLEGKLEIAKSLKENGILTELIQKTIGLSKEEIERL